jgi:integrase
LNLDPAIAGLVAAVERAAPRTKKQAAPLHEDEIDELLERRAESWFQRQVATMAGVGFLTVMRLVELRTIRTSGIRLVLKSGEHVDAHACKSFPALRGIKAILFHVPWRKQHQTRDVWIPLACPRIMQRVLDQLLEGRQQGGPVFLFPSRRRMKGKGMHLRNPLGRQQFQNELQNGLVDVCKFPRVVAKLFTGHALRIGGSNFMRRMGLADEIHRKLGGWASIQSSQGYMVLSPREQVKICEKMALTKGRTSAFEQAEVVGCLDDMASLVL